MDPFAAIGLAGNIIAFLDFGFKIISAAKEIHASTSGANADNDDLSFGTQHLHQLASNLNISKPVGSLSDQERSLLKVAAQCIDASGELEKLLDKLKASNPKSKRAAFRAAVRNWRKGDEKDTLEAKLDRCRQQLNLELLSLTRTESLERLNKLIAYGQASSDDMQSLIRNMESLRLGNTTSHLGDEALRQIQSLLNLTEDAASKVRQARVLDGLRFDLMDERFEDIEVAHKKTFNWIFDSRAGSVAGSDASTESDVDADDESVSETSDDDDEALEGYSNHSEDVEDVRSCVATTASLNNDDEANSIAPLPDNHGHKMYQPEFIDHLDNRVQIIPENDTDDNSDSSFEWFVDEPSPVDDDQKSLSSDDEESVGTSSHASSETPARPGAEFVFDSSRQILAEVRSNFIAWLEQGNGIFHISGKPGSGKSTFMKYLTQHPQTEEHLKVWASGKKLLLGKFFFWKPGSALQKNTKGLIRGLLHRLLSGYPELIPLVFPNQWELSTHREVIHIEHDECQAGFEKLIATSHANSDRKIVVFVDGLDEFEGSHAQLIRQLLQWTNKSRNVKLCISSREWAIFQDAFQDCPKLRLHEVTRSDIRQFVSDRFREIHIEALLNDPEQYHIDQLEETIVEESDGVFLWVSLVLRHVEEGLHNGDRMKDLMRLIKSLPTELEPMLQQLSDSIPPNHRKLAYSMLSLARFCGPYRNQAFLMQLSFLEEYVEDNNFAMKSTVELLTARENKTRLDGAKRRVYGVCKGFLEIRRPLFGRVPKVLGYVVHFIHRSIAEFLESPYLQEKMNREHPGFAPFDAYCQTYLGLLAHVRLPKAHFIPGLGEQTFFRDVESMIYRIIHDPQGDTLRFCEFLDSTYHTLSNLEAGITGKRTMIFLRNQVVHCNVADIVILACALCGYHEFFEFLLSRQEGISSELIALCTPLSVFGLRIISGVWPRACKTLQLLLDSGGSPNTELNPGSGPVFHTLAGQWFDINEPYVPSIAVVAFLLYQGVNPRFSMVTSTTKYNVIQEGAEHIGFKAYFISERPEPELQHQFHIARLVPNIGRLYYLRATPETIDILSEHGHVIAFRTLVSIWFPEHSNALQQAIDWIVELGVDVDAQHRLQLQSRFGPLLRPLFDQDHPDFVGRIDFKHYWWPDNSMHYVRKR